MYKKNLMKHLELSHLLWQKHIKKGSIIVDATLGNGHDTLYLVKNFLTPENGLLFGLDIQEKALQKTKILLEKEKISPDLLKKIFLYQQSHENFDFLQKNNLKADLFVYNLGYLPFGDKSKTTQTDTTIKSLKEAFIYTNEKGCISITCYPGHEEGQKEEKALLELLSTYKEYSITHHIWINRNKAPSIIWIEKNP
jgi:hypothetical protein